jgi:hypothetical protein
MTEGRNFLSLFPLAPARLNPKLRVLETLHQHQSTSK